MHIIQTINDRQAIPVRALPYVNPWLLTPDRVAEILAHTEENFQDRNMKPLPVYAYFLNNGDPVRMRPIDWDGVKSMLESLSLDLKAGGRERLGIAPGMDDKAAITLTRAEWLRGSIPCLPAGCFVWKDEFEQAFLRVFSKNKYLITNEREGQRELNYAFVLQEMCDAVLEGFGNVRQSTQAPESAGSEKASQPDWETLSPEQKKAAWDGMTKAGRQDKAPELVKKHGGNKTRAGAEVGISGNRIGQILKESEPEAPLPDNHWIREAGIKQPKQGKASR